MKAIRRSIVTLRATILVALLAPLLPFTAPAQSKDPFAPEEPAVEQGKPFSLQFPGGTVEEFAAAVERAMGEPFNLVIPESATGAEVQPLRVQQIRLRPLLEAITEASRQRKIRRVNTNSRGSNFEYVDTALKFNQINGEDSLPVWIVVAEGREEEPEIEDARHARFYQLRPALEAGVKIEEITTLAQTAWQMMKLPSGKAPELKVHEETGVLIAVGSREAVEVLESLLAALHYQNTRPAVDQPAQRPQIPRTVPLPAPNN